MSRTVFPFAAQDVSALAKSLTRELEACDGKPGHVQLLNMLTRAVGYRNFQHFRAQHAAGDRLDAAPGGEPPPFGLAFRVGSVEEQHTSGPVQQHHPR